MSAGRTPARSTPAAQGFRMPAEWELHAATWLAWPHHTPDWPGKFGAIPWVFAELVRAIARSERVRLIVRDAHHEARARRTLFRAGADLERVDFLRAATDRGWLRDMGPLFVVRERAGARELAATSWRFNGWAKYPNWRRDDAAKDRLLRKLGVRTWRPEAGGRRVVLEGGAIDVDGEGTLLATEECLLSDVQARNPGLGRAGTEQVLRDFLGAKRVVWLGDGIAGDDTHGHVDDLARFVAPGVVVLAVEDDHDDVNHRALAENRERLQGARDAKGRTLEVVPLPMPTPLFFAGTRLPASYLNFLITNGAVLVPTFNDPNDRIALGVLAELFPDRSIVGIHAVDLVWGFGTLHCLTQQEPAPGARLR
ncbi:MAG: agmatine deiminase family protein [Myxococcota bacterium]